MWERLCVDRVQWLRASGVQRRRARHCAEADDGVPLYGCVDWSNRHRIDVWRVTVLHVNLGHRRNDGVRHVSHRFSEHANVELHVAACGRLYRWISVQADPVHGPVDDRDFFAECVLVRRHANGPCVDLLAVLRRAVRKVDDNHKVAHTDVHHVDDDAVCLTECNDDRDARHHTN